MKTITANEFDEKFEAGEDVLEHCDLSRTRRLNCEIKRINVDIPVWMVEALDKEATRLSIPRQAVLKILLDRALKAESAA